MSFDDAASIIPEGKQLSGEVQWSSPSNIALIKYWGKFGRQLPRNPSISFTLKNAKTTTKISYQTKSKTEKGIKINFFFEGKKNQKFSDKIVSFFNSILDVLPFLEQLEFNIYSSNSFPHSAGIASSASAMSAIACCLCSIEQDLFPTEDKNISKQRASYIARLGSGSACRSLFPIMSIWGSLDFDDKIVSSNLYGIEYSQGVASVFHNYHDDILIVSKKEKSVSSSAGHALMDSNIYASSRYQQAEERLEILLLALKNGDQASFGKIVEDEAMTLHALMMSSNPSYLLMHPNTIAIINKVRNFRKATGENLFFTLDAGPNVHLLYPDDAKEIVQKFIKDELLDLCEDGLVIFDEVGFGPELIL